MDKHHLALAGFIALAVLSSAFFTYSHPLSDEGFFHMRQIEHIRTHGTPLLSEPFGGAQRSYVVFPLYDYLLALISVFLPLLATRVLATAALSGILVLTTYWCSLRLSRSREAAVFSAMLVAFMPALLSAGPSLSPALLAAIFTLLFCAFFMLPSEHGLRLLLCCALFCLIMLTHPLFLIIVSGLLLYVFFIKMEDLRHTLGELELVLFLCFVSTFFSLIVYTDALRLHGLGTFTGNAPSAYLSNLAAHMSVLAIAGLMGPLCFLVGIYAIFLYLFRRKNKAVYGMVCICILLAVGMSTQVIGVNDGVLVTGALLAVLCALSYAAFIEFLRKTHLLKNLNALRVFLWVCAIVLCAVTLGIAAPNFRPSFSEHDMAAAAWMRENLPASSIVLVRAEEGTMIAALARREAAIDTNFLLLPLAEERYDATQKVFTTYETDAVRILNAYNIDTIFFSEGSQAEFTRPFYLSDASCFELIFSNGAEIYAVHCTVVSR